MDDVCNSNSNSDSMKGWTYANSK